MTEKEAPVYNRKDRGERTTQQREAAPRPAKRLHTPHGRTETRGRKLGIPFPHLHEENQVSTSPMETRGLATAEIQRKNLWVQENLVQSKNKTMHKVENRI